MLTEQKQLSLFLREASGPNLERDRVVDDHGLSEDVGAEFWVGDLGVEVQTEA